MRGYFAGFAGEDIGPLNHDDGDEVSGLGVVYGLDGVGDGIAGDVTGGGEGEVGRRKRYSLCITTIDVGQVETSEVPVVVGGG